uniref:Uncharacterized protein n=1 Tax=Tanacetum cinerariifolium TaxID=118510 RepID=A0A6L2JSI6_TANCI|nr:hypothetical protein [Tanacetum cinerariifolium]
MDNKLRDALNKSIQTHNFDCREEAQAEKRDNIELINLTVKTIIKEEVNARLHQILPKAISDVATPSSYEAAVTLSEFELTKILIDKMEKNKSFDVADYKRELYDALFKSYNTDKDIFESYGEVFSLKKSRDEKDKDRDHSAGSDRGTKRRKSSKDAESSRDSKSKENKSSSTSKDASQSRHKSSGKSVHAEEPSHTVKDSGKPQDQELVRGTMINNPLTRRLSKLIGLRKLSNLLLLILIGVRDDKLTFELLRPRFVKLCLLKNLPLHLMSSMILHLISMHLS